jgi:hypothetical protein
MAPAAASTEVAVTSATTDRTLSVQSSAARRRSVRCRPRNAAPPLPQSCFVICTLTTSRRIRARPVALIRGTLLRSVYQRGTVAPGGAAAIIANGQAAGGLTDPQRLGRQS